MLKEGEGEGERESERRTRCMAMFVVHRGVLTHYFMRVHMHFLSSVTRKDEKT